jgi:acyl-coenzyme A synthetase/AMP-(fatty) acid ligase
MMETSGTTGPPKLITHSLERIVQGVSRRPPVAAPAKWLLTYPVAAFAGLQVLLTALLSGDELIATTDFRASVLACLALHYGPSHMSATPTFWRAFLAACGPALSSLPLRQITLGGEIADQATLDLLRHNFPSASIRHIYASTEAGVVFSVKDGLAGFPAKWLLQEVNGVKVRVSDSVLEVQSPRAMIGSDNIWIRTGDIVVVDSDRVHFMGRTDTLINVGGSKVLAEEVEGVLLAITGVRHARVFGVKNPITGQIVAAEVVLEDYAKPAAMRDVICKSLTASLERYKHPRLLTFVNQIGQSETGKIVRRSE